MKQKGADQPARSQPQQPRAPTDKGATSDIDDKIEPPGHKEDHRVPLGGLVQILLDQQHKDRCARQPTGEQRPPQERHKRRQQRRDCQHAQLEHGIGFKLQPRREPSQNIEIEGRVKGRQVGVDDIHIVGHCGELGDVGRVQPLVAAKAVDGKRGVAQRQCRHQEQENAKPGSERRNFAIGGQADDPNAEDARGKDQQQQLQPDVLPDAFMFTAQCCANAAIGRQRQ